MPMIWTHILFSEEVTDRTEKLANFTLDENYLILGAQGNNLLDFIPFYSQNKLFFKKQLLTLTSENSEENFIKFIHSISSTNKQVTSYIIGYITYCFLEKEMSKYLNHFSKLTHTSVNVLKTNIDTLIMHKYYNLDTRKVPVLKEFKLKILLDSNIKKSMKIINPHLAKNLQKAYLHTLIGLRWLFDPYGWKSKMFPSYTPLYDIHLKLNTSTDLLNENHVVWDEINNDSRSFIDIYNQAIFKSTEFLNLLFIFLEKKDQKSLNTAIHLLKTLNKKS